MQEELRALYPRSRPEVITTFAVSVSRDQLLGASLPVAWLNFKNADKVGTLGAMVFECLARHFVGLNWLN